MQPTQEPGRQHTGRFAALDDLAQCGVERALELLRAEGALGLYAHPPAAIDAFAARLQQAGLAATAHRWDLYRADRAALTVALAQQAPRTPSAHAPSAPACTVEVQTDWGEALTAECQALMQAGGVMPADAATLRGQLVPSRLALARAADGTLLAVGSLLWGHARPGPWQAYAQLGMHSVAPAARGQGLGTRIARALLQQALNDPATEGVCAACAPDNPASSQMVQVCGMQRDAQRSCVMFTLDGQRATR